jgi:hypothetical protein
MKTIEQLAQEAVDKNNYVRKALKDFFKKWDSINFDNTIIVNVFDNYGLSTKITRDVVEWDIASEEWYEHSLNITFATDKPIEEVKQYLNNLPQAIDKIAKVLEKRNNYEVPQEILDWINK